MIYGTLLHSPYLWHLISGSQKTPFFPCFWCFGTFWIPNEPRKNAQPLFFWEKDRGRKNQKSGATRAESEPGGRCTPDHNTEAPGATPVLNRKRSLYIAFWSSPDGSTRPLSACPSCVGVSTRASAHSPAPPDGNREQVPCFKATLFPMNFVEVLRLFGW
jgi:hypothetical protein